jgi:hypothetical protein
LSHGINRLKKTAGGMAAQLEHAWIINRATGNGQCSRIRDREGICCQMSAWERTCD